MVTKPLKEVVKRFPELYEFLPVDLIVDPDYMCSVYFKNGKRHFSIFDSRDPYNDSRLD